MKRRELLMLMGGAAVWPVRAHSQKQAARVGVLMDDNGGLVAYGIDLDEQLPKAADYVSSNPERRESGRAACAGAHTFQDDSQSQDREDAHLQIPPTLLALADEVIE